LPALSAFRSLAELLRGDETVEIEQPAPELPSEPVHDIVEVMRDARLFRARIAEAVEEAAAGVLQRIAADVLCRELQMAPCEIEAVVETCVAQLADRQDLRIFVHPDDAPAVRSFEVQRDATLERGDCRLELAYGSVHSTLQLRLAEAAGAQP
jgi:flagellar biosynthesis/type III secretory pathway protein FliH